MLSSFQYMNDQFVLFSVLTFKMDPVKCNCNTTRHTKKNSDGSTTETETITPCYRWNGWNPLCPTRWHGIEWPK